MLKVLVFTTLYPNSAAPNHGVFVENRIRNTAALGDVELTILAPVPFFPFSGAIFGRYGRFADVIRQENRHGIEVHHPRYTVIPKVGMTVGPQFLYRAARKVVRQFARSGRTFDVIDAHYFYPDGVAAALLAKEFRIPFVVTSRGSDITQIGKFRVPQKQILGAARQASALVTVCDALRLDLIALGAQAEKIVVLRNGVDLKGFSPVSAEPERKRLGLERFTLISVGSLIGRKGHELTIRALDDLPDCELLIVGEGPDRRRLEALARTIGVADRVRLMGEVPHSDLPRLYSACQVMVLMSEREGWANVILESLACGTPVIATNVGGTAEILRDSAAGHLLESRSTKALVEAVRRLQANPPLRSATRRYAERFGWENIARANRALLQQVAAGTPDLEEVSRLARDG